MTTHLERRRRATWRGIPFEVSSLDGAFGRHTVEHIFPLRDDVYIEELAIKPRHHRISGFVIGDDYDRERNRFIAAAEKGGEGTLQHPTLGRLRVKLVDFSISEPQADGLGKAELSFDFVESSPRLYPAIRVEPAQQLGARNDTMRDDTTTRFAEDFTIDGVPGWVADAVGHHLDEVFAFVEQSAAEDWNDWTSEDWLAIDQAFAIVANPGQGTVESEPATWGGLVQDAFDTVGRFDFCALFIQLIGDDPIDSSVGSGSWDQDNLNKRAIYRLWRRAALSTLVDTLIDGQAELESVQDALALQAQLVGYFDAELAREDTQDDPKLFDSLYSTKLAALAWLEGVAATLEVLRTFTPPKTTPLLVVAQRIYGDPDRAEEIADRNQVEHPLFAAGGRSLLVLSA